MNFLFAGSPQGALSMVLARKNYSTDLPVCT
jgi:hypothetical protein